MIDWDITLIELIFEHFNKKELLEDFKKYQCVNFGKYSLLLEIYNKDNVTVFHKQKPDYKHYLNHYVVTLKDNNDSDKYWLREGGDIKCVIASMYYAIEGNPDIHIPNNHASEGAAPKTIDSNNDAVCITLETGIYKVEFEGVDGNPNWFTNKEYSISLVRFKYSSGHEDYVQVKDHDGSMIFESPKRLVKIFFR
jgi:hypothetical protein